MAAASPHRRPILHAAAMPFPSAQGTQAAFAAMLEASQAAGRRVEALTYGYGAGGPPPPYPLHRLREWPRIESLRSGPSAGKILLDLQMAFWLGARRSSHFALIAHNVEAAAAGLLAGARPLIYFAHTSMQTELPSYFDATLRIALGAAGGRLDRLLCRRADAVAAISPALRGQLERDHGIRARYVPTPWPLPAPITRAERAEARAALGLEASGPQASGPQAAPLLLYAGNLDAYQGWEVLLAALSDLRERRPRARLLVLTASAPGPLHRAAQRAGLAGSILVRPLLGERERRQAHAAADLAIVPRAASGGLPIKLLDAMSRGRAVVLGERALAGLECGEHLWITRGDAPAALAARIEEALEGSERRERGEREARAWIGRAHSGARFLEALDALLEPLMPTLEPGSPERRGAPRSR
ncbi:MAG: glycosyltransferase [Myxococcales bacterium]|nr:glycosyltransferase [Myxococcales bacterium]